MRQIILLFGAMILIPSSAMGQIKDQVAQMSDRSDLLTWKRYTVKGEEFSVTLPNFPSMVTAQIFHLDIQKSRKERQVRTAANGVSYMIQVFKNGKPRQTLDEFIADENALMEIDATTGRDVTINSIRGKEYSLRKKSPPARAQFFATEKRLYRFFAIGADEAGVKQFFSSIVLGKTDGIKISDGLGHQLEYDTTGKIYTSREVDVRAGVLTREDAAYTMEATENKVKGIVILKVVFTGLGYVTDIRVVQGLPYGLTQQAIKVARNIKFIPAMKDGKYVSMVMQLEYNFNLY